MPTLTPLDAVDPALLETHLDRCFGEERKARTAYRIREGTQQLAGLGFAALDDEDYLAGTIQAWPIALHGRAGKAHPLVMVGPVAVASGYQGEGYGKALMAALLGAMDLPGAPAPPQLLIGDPDYYGRWGFNADETAGWHCPGPVERERLLLRNPNRAPLPRDGMLGPWTAPDPATKD